MTIGIVFLFSLHLLGGEHIVLVRIPLASAFASAMALAQHFLVCTVSCESVVGFLPFHGYIIGT